MSIIQSNLLILIINTFLYIQFMNIKKFKKTTYFNIFNLNLFKNKLIEINLYFDYN